MTGPTTGPTTGPQASQVAGETTTLMSYPPPTGRPVRSAGRVTRFTAFLVAVACVLVAGAAVKFTPLLSEAQITYGRVGEPVRFYKTQVTVTQVQAGTVIADEYSGDYRSKGLLLAVTIKMAAPEEQQRLDASNLYADEDRVYAAVQSGGMTVPVGFEGTSTFVYEVDPRHVDDLYLEAGDGSIFTSYPQLIRIDLGISSDNAEQWRRAGQGRTVEPQPLPELAAIP